MKYTTLLFDADDTLLDFSKAERSALKSTFSKHEIPVSDELLKKFSEVNLGLWKLFEQEKIEKADIIKRRFADTLAFFNIPYSPDIGLEADYQALLSQQYFLVEHADEVAKELSKTHDMYIITNGLLKTQKNRFENCGILPYFKGYFVSEAVGHQKPAKEYFDYVFNAAGCDSSNTLIIGDSCSSDINGAILSGTDSCWFNPKNLPMTALKEPTYEIKDLRELIKIV